MKFKLLKLKPDTKIDTVMIRYDVGFDTSGKVNFFYYHERLSNRSKNFQIDVII